MSTGLSSFLCMSVTAAICMAVLFVIFYAIECLEEREFRRDMEQGWADTQFGDIDDSRPSEGQQRASDVIVGLMFVGCICAVAFGWLPGGAQ